ncbi:MAG: VanZ family protein [Gemmatimonadota bacterium]
MPVIPATHRQPAPLELRVGRWLTAAATAVIGGLTLLPDPDGARLAALTPFLCLVCGEYGGVDVVLNLLLFLPLGAGLGLMRVPARRAIFVMVFATVLIETLQAVAVAGRDASLSDLLTNSIGGCAGFWLAAHWRQLVIPDQIWSRRLSRLTTAGWIAVWGLSSWLMQRALPPVPWWGQLAAPGVTAADYPGRILRAEVGGVGVSIGQIADILPVVERLQAESATVRLTAAPGPATRNLASMFGLLNGHQQEALLIAQDGRDLVFRVRRHSSDLGLRQLELVVPGGAGQPGDTVAIVGTLTGTGQALRSVHGADTVAGTLELTPSLGWMMLLPGAFRRAALIRWLNILWLALWIAPVAYYGSRATRLSARGSLRQRLGLAGAIGAGLWLLPLCLHGPTGSAFDLLGAAIGVAAGEGLSSWSAGLEPRPPGSGHAAA